MNERLDLKAQNDNRIMTVLRLREISHEICVTDRGHLRLTLNKDGAGKDYRFVLDAVPVEPKVNKELLELFADIICPIDVQTEVMDINEEIGETNHALDHLAQTLNGMDERLEQVEKKADETAEHVLKNTTAATI